MIQFYKKKKRKKRSPFNSYGNFDAMINYLELFSAQMKIYGSTTTRPMPVNLGSYKEHL
jgi:hypothetical protein